MARLPVPILHRIFPVAGRRVIVIDPGTRAHKLLAVESHWGRLRILLRQTIEVDDGDPEAPLSLREQLAAAMPEIESERLALVLPQHRTISTVLEVPHETEDAGRFIESEVRKVSGLSEEALFHAHAPLEPFARLRNPCSVTLCKREDVDAFVDRLVPAAEEDAEATDREGLAEIVTTGQAMFAAILAGANPPPHAVVVDLGANHTVVGILLNGQGVHATSFDGGTSRFTDAMAAEHSDDWSAAEALRRSKDVFTPPHGSPACVQAAAQWYADLQRAVVEWMDDYPELGIPWQSLPVYLCGGGASQPGLVDHLNRLGSLRFQPWPKCPGVDPDLAMDQYWVAYGAARAALGRAGSTVSLLPPELKTLARRHRRWEWLQAANIALLLLIGAALGLATWQQSKLLDRKKLLIGETRAALLSAETVVHLAQRLDAGYAALRPMLQRQQHSLDTLAALAAIRQIRTNDDFWLALFADAASYATAPILPPPTNAVNEPVPPPSTNAFPPRREFIAELCIPQQGDAARRILSQVVSDLKQKPIFERADALPPERRRAVVDPRVVITNRVFAIAMEVASGRTNGVIEALLQPDRAPAPRRSGPAPRPRDGASPGITEP